MSKKDEGRKVFLLTPLHQGKDEYAPRHGYLFDTRRADRLVERGAAVEVDKDGAPVFPDGHPWANRAVQDSGPDPVAPKAGGKGTDKGK